MSRLDIITIGIVIVCLAALGYLVYKIVNMMNPPEETTTSIADGYGDSGTVEDTTYVADSWDDEVADADSDTDLDDDELDYSTTDDEAETNDAGGTDDEMDDSTLGNAEEDEDSYSNPSNSSIASQTASQTASSNTGRYMVLAGSYRQRGNADAQASKLRRLGYNDTEVRLFDRGSYAVVLVDRFSSLSQASQLVRDLADKGIEAFVKEKN